MFFVFPQTNRVPTLLNPSLAISCTDSRVSFTGFHSIHILRFRFDWDPRLSDFQTVLLRTQTESFLYVEGEKSAPLWKIV